MNVWESVKEYLGVERKDVEVTPMWWQEKHHIIARALEEDVKERELRVKRLNDIAKWHTYANKAMANGLVLVWMPNNETGNMEPVWIMDGPHIAGKYELVDLVGFLPDWVAGEDKNERVPKIGWHTYVDKDTNKLKNDYVMDVEDHNQSINRYQRWTNKTALWQDKLVYDSPKNGTILHLLYLANTINEEAGELSGKVKRMIRDHDGVLEDKIRYDMIKELGDMFYYMAQFANELDIPLSTVLSINVSKLEDRLDREAIQGSGDER